MTICFTSQTSLMINRVTFAKLKIILSYKLSAYLTKRFIITITLKRFTNLLKSNHENIRGNLFKHVLIFIIIILNKLDQINHFEIFQLFDFNFLGLLHNHQINPKIQSRLLILLHSINHLNNSLVLFELLNNPKVFQILPKSNQISNIN